MVEDPKIANPLGNMEQDAEPYTTFFKNYLKCFIETVLRAKL